ncbi:hypothetical protein MCOR25_009406 [Pyricularia grisea]|nr:hypothetical protein MCOR25_009406 [Pyricularia grisea]
MIASTKFYSLAETSEYVRKHFDRVHRISYTITRSKDVILERTGMKATGTSEEAKNDKDHPEFSKPELDKQKAMGDSSSQARQRKESQKQGQDSNQKQETEKSATENQEEHDSKITATAQSRDPDKPIRIGYLSRLFGPKRVFGVNGPHGPVPDDLVWAITRRGRYAMNLIDADTRAIEKGPKTDQSDNMSKASNIEDILAMNATLDPCTVSFFITHLAYALHDELPETSFDYLSLDLLALEVIREIADKQRARRSDRFVDKLAEDLGRLALDGPSQEIIGAFVGDPNVADREQGIDKAKDDSGPPEPSADLNLPKLAAEEILRWTSTDPRPCCVASKRLCELGAVICMDHCCSSGWAAQRKTQQIPVVQKKDEEKPHEPKSKKANGKGESKEKVNTNVSGGRSSSK